VTAPLLEWSAGDTATFHDIYFGTSPDLGPEDFVKQESKDMTMYWHVPGLTPGATYYWRIDEVEADGTTIHTGDVWSFTAASSTAYDPNPPDGARLVQTDAELSWEPGATAFTHDVYFGTDETAVTNGTGDTFQGNQPDATFNPGALAKDTMYYWRIDEIESDDTTTHTGDVWRFTTIPDIPISDPNLIGWWKLDAGSGTIALDWSGHNMNGTLQNDPQWADGYDGGALQFDGTDDSVELGDFVPPLQGTVTFWMNPASVGPRGRIFGGADEFEVYVENDVLANQLFAAGGAPEYLESTATIPTDTWTHVALTYDGTSQRLQIYLNGTLDAENSTGDDVWAGGAVALGHRAGRNQEYYQGLLDDVRIYNVVLNQEQIKETMRGDLTLAWDPKPADGATTDVEGAVPLTWRPGEKAAQHHVYLGTDELAVETADTSDTTGIYRGQRSVTNYSPPELGWGQTYYWRVDEQNTDATTSRGRLWSFTVADYLIVDDFEDYNDFTPDRVWQTWLDGFGYSEPPPGFAGNGTGSQVGNDDPPFTEQTIVHSGRQAMTFRYTNDGSTGKALYSEAAREWAVPQDWTRRGVKALTLWFNGDAANSAEPLYVGVQDSLGTRKDVTHENGSAVIIDGWEEWNIDLQEFANAGVSLISVKKLILGVGNRVAPQAGGTGTLYFDDVRLYRPRCIPSEAKPAASLNADCVVDDLDLQLLAGDWLMQDVPEPVWNGTFTSQDVGAPAAAGSYSFDGTTYTIQGNGNDIWGNADNFHYAHQQISGDTQMTVRVTRLDPVHSWAKAGIMIRDTLDAGSANAMVAITGGSGNGGTFQWRTDADGGSDSSRTLTGISPPSCIKLVREGNTFTGYIFLDGKWQQEGISATVPMTDPVYIGLAVTSHTDGTLTTATFDRGCTFSAAELHQDGVIDFADYAVLAGAWLDEVLWPEP
jgi:hypothetical protein